MPWYNLRSKQNYLPTITFAITRISIRINNAYNTDNTLTCSEHKKKSNNKNRRSHIKYMLLIVCDAIKCKSVNIIAYNGSKIVSGDLIINK